MLLHLKHRLFAPIFRECVDNVEDGNALFLKIELGISTKMANNC